LKLKGKFAAGTQTGIGFGSKETTTPAISAILCMTEQNKMLEDTTEEENKLTRMATHPSRIYLATHTSSPAEIPTEGPTWNSHC
jgi:hypothetical protein